MRAPRRRTVVLTFLALLGAVLLLLALGLFPQDPVRRLVEARLRDAFGPATRVGRIQVVPGRLEATLHDVVIDSPAFRIEAPEARLRLGTATLTGGALTIRSVDVSRPRVWVHASASTPASKPAVVTRPILVDRIAVRGGELSIDHAALGGPAVFQSLDVDGSMGKAALEIRATGGEWRRATPVPIGPLAAKLRVSPLLAVDLDSLDASLGRSRLQASGGLGRVTSPKPDLRFSADLDAGEIAAIAGGPEAAGRVAVTGRIASGAAGPELEAELVPSTLSAYRVSVDGGRAHLVHRGGESVLTLAALETFGGTVSGEARLADARTRGNLRAAGLDVARLRALFAPTAPAASGAVAGRVSWSGSLDSDVRGEAHIEGQGHSTSLQALRLVLDAEGRLAPKPMRGEARWRSTLDAQGPDDSALASLLLEAEGTLARASAISLSGHASGTARLRTPAGHRELLLQADSSLESSRLSANVVANGLGGVITVDAEADGDTVRSLSARATSLDLATVLPEATGTASASVVGAGPADRLALSGSGRIDALTWRGTAFGSVDLDVSGDSRLPEVAWRAPALQAKGEVRLVGADAFSGTVHLDHTPLAPLSTLASTPLEGEVAGDVEFHGPRADPGRLHAEVRLESAALTAHGHSLRAASPVKAAYEAGVIRIDALAIEGDGAHVEAAGTLATSADKPSALQASVGLDLAQVKAPEAWDLAGRIEARVDASGTLRQPRLNGAIDLRSIAISGPRLPPVHVADGEVRLEGDVIQVPGLEATLAGGRATASGHVPLAALLRAARRREATLEDAEGAALRLSWTGLDAASLLTALQPGSETLVSGSLAGEAALEGGLGSLRELRGSVTMPETTLTVEDLQVQVGAVAIQLRQGVARLPETVVSAEGGSLKVQGSVDLAARSFEGSGSGQLDLRALAPLLEVRLSGSAALDIKASGPFKSPTAHGTLDVAGATLRVRDVPQAVTDLKGRLVFEERRVLIESATGTLGGGPLSLAGSARFSGGGLGDVDVTLTGRDMALRYPEGLRTRAEADLRLSGQSGDLRLAGTVKARAGRYDLEKVLRESLRGRPAPRPTASPFLRTIGLDITVTVERPIVVTSSLTDVRVGGRLSILGNLETPEPNGTLAVEPGGRAFLQGRTFDVDRGLVLYEGTWDPTLDTAMKARIHDAQEGTDYDVTVSASGALSNPALTFDSTPSASETEIRSLIATGNKGASTFESSKVIAGGQAASFLAGGIGRSLGLDEVTPQPQLLSREQDPGARFTFGKRITRHVELAYSISLDDAEDRFVQLSAETWKDLTGLVQVREDGTYALGAGQRLEFGGPPRQNAPRRRERTRLTEVRFEGQPSLPEAEMRKALGVKPGSRPGSFALQERTDKLREWLIGRGYLEAETSVRLDGSVAVVRVQTGPRYSWTVEGMTAPPSLDSVVRSAFFADEALEMGRQRLRHEMWTRGYLRAEVQGKDENGANGRVLRFTVKPGRRYASAELRFPGIKVLSESKLREAVGGAEAVIGSERNAKEAVRAAYAEANHLAAEAGPLGLREEGDRFVIELPVQEGPRARIASVDVDGSTLPAEETAAALRLETGADFDENDVTRAGQRLRDHYIALGYPKVRVTFDSAVAGTDVAVRYRVVEGPQLRIGAMEVTGATRTRRSLILGQFALKPGDVLDLRKLAAGERKLRALGLFRRVATRYTDSSPAVLTIEVEEQALVAARYQLRYNQEDGVTAEIEPVLQNVLGSGITLGGRYRRGADVDERRGSLDFPSIFRGHFVATLFRLFERVPGGTDFDGNLVENEDTQRGFQVQQSTPLPNRWNLLLGYRFKRVTTESPLLESPVEFDIAALDFSLLRETRDNPVDSRRGRFWSLTLELSPQALGSEVTFAKAFFQAFFARPVSPTLTWAQGYRLGLAKGFNRQEVISSERFRAGGANSLRGFETDSVGPRDEFVNSPLGGDAVVILNQELRYRHHTGLGAVAFYDGGNVFARVSDLSFDLRHVLGGGLRYASPVGLLRLDLGFPLFRKPGESSYQLFFSFGQAF